MKRAFMSEAIASNGKYTCWIIHFICKSSIIFRTHMGLITFYRNLLRIHSCLRPNHFLGWIMNENVWKIIQTQSFSFCFDSFQFIWFQRSFVRSNWWYSSFGNVTIQIKSARYQRGCRIFQLIIVGICSAVEMKPNFNGNLPMTRIFVPLCNADVKQTIKRSLVFFGHHIITSCIQEAFVINGKLAIYILEMVMN